MAETIKLEIGNRVAAGSAAARRLRNTGVVPGTISTEKGIAESVQFDAHGFDMILKRHRGENLVIDLHVGGGAPRKVLLKEVQHEPVYGKVLHADFVEVSMTRKIRVHVTLSLIGEPIGVREQGGMLDQLLREVEVECLVVDIPEVIELDVSGMSIGHVLRVSDLKVPPNLTIVTGIEVAVASVILPRLEEEKPEEEVAAEGSEPEVIGEKDKKEGEAGATPEKGEKAEKGKEKPEKGKEKPEKAEKKGGKEK
jgi:large subunit ribosomal protein L25